MFEDTKGVIRSRKGQNDKQQSTKQYKQKLKIEPHEPPLKSRGEPKCFGRTGTSCSTSG